jgi:hypothetical protein
MINGMNLNTEILNPAMATWTFNRDVVLEGSAQLPAGSRIAVAGKVNGFTVDDLCSMTARTDPKEADKITIIG